MANRRDSFVPHPMVKWYVEEMERQGLTQATVGRLSDGAVRGRAISDWLTRTNPTLTMFEAALDVMGLKLAIVPGGEKKADRPYGVYMVAYVSEMRGYEAVAVSAQSHPQAMERVKMLRLPGLEVLVVHEIPGRVPLKQDTCIEGMVDLENRMRPPPDRGSPVSKSIRARNYDTILKRWGPEDDAGASHPAPHVGSAEVRATNQ